MKNKQGGYSYEEIWDIDWALIVRATKVIQTACRQCGKITTHKRYRGKAVKAKFYLTSGQ
jgi:hypothetical protein